MLTTVYVSTKTQKTLRRAGYRGVCSHMAEALRTMKKNVRKRDTAEVL